MNEEKIEVDQSELIDAATKIMDFCQTEGMKELLAYMAMISITNTMEETLGYGYKRKSDS